MLTEDYVSFEIAKLLKEKGFNERTNMPHIDDYQRLVCYIPTLQMAMKWLREVHNIDIEVRTYYLNYLKPNDTRYYSGKILKDSEDVIHTIYSKDTYEEVCEDAIKYCLEILI